MKSVEKWAAEIDEYGQTESKVRAIRDEQRQACVKAYVDARRNGGGDMECQVAIGNAGNAGKAPALKPCPFCGGEARTDFAEPDHYLIDCREKSCAVRPWALEKTEVGAIAAWNKRVG